MDDQQQFRKEFIEILQQRTGWSEGHCVEVFDAGGHDESASARDAVEDYLAETAGELDEDDQG